MRIVIADKLAPAVVGALQDLGGEVVVGSDLSGDALVAALAQHAPDVLVVRSTKVEAAHFAAAPAMSLVIRAGAGVNTIDLATAGTRGVYVANCPGRNAAAVAELAMGHLINLDRRIADNVAALRTGRWNKQGFSAARGLRGRTLAILGCGQIGKLVIERAQAFGMNVVAWSRSLTDEHAEALGIARAETPEEAVRQADAVSVHLALSKETRGRIGESVFEAMRPGTYFINTSRGEVVDQVALLAAIEGKALRAGLDVFDREPTSSQGSFEHPIHKNEHVYGTHHIGASTDEAEEAVGAEVVRIVKAYRDGEPIPNCVNLAVATDATHLIVVRHADRVGVLAHILGALREAGHNVQEMQNIVFQGGQAACARIAVVNTPLPETLARIESHDDIYATSVATLR